MNYRVNIVFSHKVNPQTLIDDFFDSAIAQVEKLRAIFEEKVKNGVTFPGDNDQYLKFSKQNSKNLQTQKLSASVETVENGFKLSFDVPHQEKFDLIDEEGKRMWLRNYIDATTINYVTTGLSAKIMEYISEHKEKPNETFVPFLLSNAFYESLKDSYSKKTETFWIDGE